MTVNSEMSAELPAILMITIRIIYYFIPVAVNNKFRIDIVFISPRAISSTKRKYR